MKELAKHDRSKVIHLLEERLAFERAGVKLYDRVLAAVRAFDDADVEAVRPELEACRNEEREHLGWLEAQLRALRPDPEREAGAVAHATGGAWTRVEEVAESDAALPQLVNALLAAKLADEAGWDLLAQIADEAGDLDARHELRTRLHDEQDHLVVIRQLMEKLVFTEVLAEDANPGAADPAR